jgi:hypothetical protein
MLNYALWIAAVVLLLQNQFLWAGFVLIALVALILRAD